MSNNGWDPVRYDQWRTAAPDDEDEDLSQPPEPGMTWNPAKEEWSHATMTHAEWETLTPSEQAEYSEPSEDDEIVDLQQLAAEQPGFAQGIAEELRKLDAWTTSLSNTSVVYNQNESEGGRSKQN